VRSRLAVIALAAAALAGSSILPAAAQCVGGGLPDGRLRATACGGAGANGGELDATIHFGAYDSTNAVGLGPDGAFVTNVPFFADRVAIGASGPQIDGMELVGPTPIESSLGNGGLSAGFSPTGTVAVLSWPNPSYFNQMDYLTRSRNYDPRLGAAENQGAFAGIDYAIADGSRKFSWLRDWSATQRYRSGVSNALVTEFSRDGATVIQTSVVSPAQDVLIIHYDVFGLADARIVYFENLNPNLYKVPFLPGQDSFLWPGNDFGAFWSDDAKALVHFRPLTTDPGSFLNVVEGSPDYARSTLRRDLAAAAKPGVAFAITSRPAPIAHQVGIDAFGLLREGAPELGGEDAYYDAGSRGAGLSGADAALGQVDAAIAVPMQDGSADVLIGAAHTMERALALVAAADYATVLGAEESYWQDWLADAKLPTSSANLDVDRRALIAIRNATAEPSGAIVASIARQSAYAEDWTRDGSFFNYALELAGHPEMVDRHNRFYARAQRPNGTWGTMYYADGEEGGPFLYEIDQQGLATWTLWQHYVFSSDRVYLDDVYPAIRRSADWMTLYADPTTGKQGPAMEDDNVFPSQGLQGAITVWLGVTSAVRAARVVGDSASESRWQARADQLRAAMLAQYFPQGRFDPGSEGYGQHFGYQGDFGAAAWVLWPAGLLDPRDPVELAMLQTLAAYLYDWLDDTLSHAAILSYQQKGIQALGVYLGMGLALPGGRDPAKVSQWVDFYHRDLPTPTLHFGEQIWRLDGGWANRVDMPHAWSGALVYLDAIAVTCPKLSPYRPWELGNLGATCQ
jgi:GH15 family glucan-1,4-alpha-glucosidase